MPRQTYKTKLAVALWEKERRNLQSDYAAFVRESWGQIDPHQFVNGRHIGVLGEYLTAFKTGQIKRLIVNMPPRLGKSSLCTIQFPAWIWTTLPETQWMFSSYGEELSVNDHSVRRRRLIESPWYQQRWNVQFTADSNQKHLYTNLQNGFMYSTATGSSATGKGADWLVIDDPLKAKDAYSEAKRTEANTFIRETLFTRLNDRNNARILLVAQRLHDDDSTASLLEDGGWTHLCLAAESQAEETIFLPISNKTWTRPAGHILEPHRYNTDVLAQMQIDLGPTGYATQMLQKPAPAGGIIFNPNTWQYFQNPPQFEIVVLSVDCSFKDTSTSDFVSIQTWGFVGPKSYLLNKQTDQLGYAATKQAIRSHIVSLAQQGIAVNCVLVEDKANGSAVINELRTEFNMTPIQPEGGKEARAWACQPDQANSLIYLPDVSYEAHRETTWVGSFVELCSKFRGEGSVKHDDDVDAFTQAVNWRRSNRLGIYEYYKEKALQTTTSPKAAEPKEQVREQFENKVGHSLGKISINPQTPRCPICGNLSLQTTYGTSGEVVSRICLRCTPKCSRCKGTQLDNGLCLRCGFRNPTTPTIIEAIS